MLQSLTWSLERAKKETYRYGETILLMYMYIFLHIYIYMEKTYCYVALHLSVHPSLIVRVCEIRLMTADICRVSPDTSAV